VIDTPHKTAYGDVSEATKVVDNEQHRQREKIQKEINSPYWFLQLELPGVTTSSNLVLGRYSMEAQFEPDINLTWFNSRENNVAPRHLVFQVSRKTVKLGEDIVESTYLDNELLKPDHTYQFFEGSVVRIRNLQIIIHFMSPIEFAGRSHHILQLACVNESEQNRPSIQDLVQPVYVKELQAQYPAWIVERARSLSEVLTRPIGETLHLILAINVSAARNETISSLDQPVRAIFHG